MKLNLKIVTPDKIFFEGDIDRIICRGVQGDLAVLPGRAPFVTQLEISGARIKNDNESKIVAIAGGYLHVDTDGAKIVSDACEYADEIDLERAKKAMERAQRRLKDHEEDIDVMRAEIALRKAINRLDLIDKHQA
jgi:F-type H+-transporting ATPase subunit epsilon